MKNSTFTKVSFFLSLFIFSLLFIPGVIASENTVPGSFMTRLTFPVTDAAFAQENDVVKPEGEKPVTELRPSINKPVESPVQSVSPVPGEPGEVPGSPQSPVLTASPVKNTGAASGQPESPPAAMNPEDGGNAADKTDLLKESLKTKTPDAAETMVPASPPDLPVEIYTPETENTGKPEIKTYDKKTDLTKAAKEGSPVIVNGKTFFNVYATIGLSSPKARAEYISIKLQKLIDDPNVDSSKLKSFVEEKKGTCAIFYDQDVVMVMSRGDADAYGISLELAGVRVIDVIEQEILLQKAKLTEKKMHTGIAIGLAGLVLLIFFLILMGKLYRWLLNKIRSLKGSWIRSITIQHVELFSEDGMMGIILLLLQIARISVILLLLYTYFNSFLGFIPGTGAVRNILYTVPLTYLKNFIIGVISYLPKLVFIIMAIYGTRIVLNISDKVFLAIKEGKITIAGFHEDYFDLTEKISRFMIYFFALVLIMPNLPGYDSPVFKGLSVFTGVIFSIGSSAWVGNILAGINIVYTRAFKMGDVVQIGENLGEVKEMSLLSTRLRTPLKTDISIPNSLILQNQVVNYSSSISSEGGIILKTAITIGYDAPGEVITRLSLQAIDKTENLLKDPKPYVLQNSLDDFYVSYWICAYTDKPLLMKKTYSELHKNIRHEFDSAGVEIMSPHYSTLRDGNRTTIPENYLPKDYESPTFNITTREAKKEA